MGIPHKHAELIKAWADGAEIEVLDCGRWVDVKQKWEHYQNPFWYSNMEYRIKPEPKPDVVKLSFAGIERGAMYMQSNLIAPPNLKLTFDGETGDLKSAEVIK